MASTWPNQRCLKSPTPCLKCTSLGSASDSKAPRASTPHAVSNESIASRRCIVVAPSRYAECGSGCFVIAGLRTAVGGLRGLGENIHGRQRRTATPLQVREFCGRPGLRVAEANFLELDAEFGIVQLAIDSGLRERALDRFAHFLEHTH